MVRYYNNSDCTDFRLQASLDFQRIEHSNPEYQIVCLPVFSEQGEQEEVGVGRIAVRIAQHAMCCGSSMQNAHLTGYNEKATEQNGGVCGFSVFSHFVRSNCDCYRLHFA